MESYNGIFMKRDDGKLTTKYTSIESQDEHNMIATHYNISLP